MRFKIRFLAGLLLTGFLALAPDTSFARGGGAGGHIVAGENVLAQPGAFYPSASSSFTSNRKKTAIESLSPASASGNRYYSLYTTQVGVSHTPDVFGLNRRTVESLEAQAKLSNETLRCIFEKYGASSRAFGVGKFLPSVTQDSLRKEISEVVANGRARPSTHGPFGTLYEYEFPSDMGRSTLGIPTRWLRVIVGPNGDVATAYPD